MRTLFSPAKINLFLRILRRREDGYHELASLFQTISLGDTLHFELANHDHLTCSDPTLPTDASNLVLKAADLFRKKTGQNIRINVHLQKRIPHQAGLGGGSSNAATTLWALNQLCGQPASLEQLIAWSAEIGSDITFFLSQGTAYCTGRGEKIQNLKPLPPTSFWIIKPDEGISTPDVFKALDIKSLVNTNPDEILKGFLKGNPLYCNDLETPAFKILPRLAKLKQQLITNGFSPVFMSGSGSSLVCMGNGLLPPLEKTSHFSAHFINRPTGEWYQEG